jgi:uncharacterized membrane protein
MAGIGFELRKAIHEASYLGVIRGYLYAAVISSGPWLLAIITLSMLGVISIGFLPQEARDLFAATTTHAFAISLITIGLIQMLVTRYLADRMYVNDTAVIVPTYVAVLVLSSVFQFALMNLLLWRTGLPWDFRLPAIALYVSVSGTWLSMIFLSAAKDYVSIVLAFVAGFGVSFVGALILGPRFGPSGHVAGFALGQVLTLALLTGRVLGEFETERTFSLKVFTYLRKYPSLLAIGVLYNLAFWVDKVVFWFSREGVDAGSYLRVFPIYDTSFFMASLTIVPALALFLVRIETAFYEHYKGFYAAIANQRSWREIAAAKEGMVNALPGLYLTLLKVQGAIALLTIGLTPVLMVALRVPQSYWYVFRVAVLAISVQVFLLVTVLLLLYLDLRGSVLIVSSLFFATNLVFTLITLWLGFPYYGYGFLFASVVTLIVALLLLDNRLRNLEYLTFTRQPLIPETD